MPVTRVESSGVPERVGPEVVEVQEEGKTDVHEELYTTTTTPPTSSETETGVLVPSPIPSTRTERDSISVTDGTGPGVP